MIKKSDNIFIFIFAAIILLFFSRNILLGETFFLRDITYLFHPWKVLCSEAVQKGEIPLWNPYAFCGMPLMANWQSAVFYPFSLLFYLFDFSAALKAFHLFHIFLAGLSAYLFGKKCGFTKSGSAAMMFVFAFNGYLITRMEFLSHLSVDIWIFFLLLLIRNPVLLAFTLSAAFLGGHQMFFLQLFILLLFFIFETDNFRKRLLPFLLAFVVFSAIVSVQLLPTHELVKLSARAKEGIDFTIATINSVKPADIFRLLNPFLRPSDAPILAGEHFSWTNTFNVGIFALFFAVLGALKSFRNRRVIFAFFLVFAGVFLGLGSNNPFYAYLYNTIPFFKVMRYPVQFMYLAVAGIALLAAAGINKFPLKGIFTLLIAIELLLANSNYQVLARNSFFTEKPESVKALQLNIRNFRFILSPGTEKNRNVPGYNIVDGWQNARGYLYSLTSLPYHLSNAYGYGEPLTVSSVENLVNTCYKQDNAQDCLPYFRRLGVKYFICKKPLANTRGFKLIGNTSPLIYEIVSPEGKLISEGKSSILEDAPGKSVISTDFSNPEQLIWKETYYPGWHVFSGNEKLPVNVWGGVFREIEVPAGRRVLYQVYRPWTFYLGLLITIAALTIMLFRAVAILKTKKPAQL
ncbi:MAG: hypothetical protein ABII64_03885 [Elusimicrobiota bacterium]